MFMSQYTKAQRTKIMSLLEEHGTIKAVDLREQSGLDRDVVKAIARDLVKEGVAKLTGDNPEKNNSIQLVEVPKKAAAKAPAKVKKPAPVMEPEDDDFADDFADDPDEADEFADEFDSDVDTDDHGEDIAEEAPAPKKVAAPKKAPAKKAEDEVALPFAMAFKPIDSLTTEELQARVDESIEAAEAIHADGFPNVAEMLMRSVAKAKRQLAKRQ